MSFTLFSSSFFFFFNDTATTEIYTLSLHDALPISLADTPLSPQQRRMGDELPPYVVAGRSEEHTSELQSLAYLVCRLLLEKKKQIAMIATINDCIFKYVPIMSRASATHIITAGTDS